MNHSLQHPNAVSDAKAEEVPQLTPEQQAEQFAERRKSSMYDRIAKLGGPSKEQIAAWKAAAPGNRLRAFSLDDVRFYIVRAISGLELSKVQKEIPQNSTEPEREMQIATSALCTMWTNTARGGKLTEADLRMGTAGLPSSIWTLIATLSDYADPSDFQQCSVEL